MRDRSTLKTIIVCVTAIICVSIASCVYYEANRYIFPPSGMLMVDKYTRDYYLPNEESKNFRR